MLCACGRWLFHAGPCSDLTLAPLGLVDLFPPCEPPLPYDPELWMKVLFSEAFRSPPTLFQMLSPREN